MKDNGKGRGTASVSRYAMFFRILGSSLIRRRSRMLVALLAIAIGATVFLGMGAVYYDVPRQMGREFRSYGANVILAPSGADSVLSLEEAARAARVIPAEKLVGATPFRYETMYYNMQGLTVAGTDFSSVRKTRPYWRIEGEWPQKDDEILLGVDVAEHARLYAGSTITLEIIPARGRRFKKEFAVSGLMRSGGPEDGFALMSVPALESLLGRKGTADVVELSVAASSDELTLLLEGIQAEAARVAPRPVKRIADSETSVLGKLQVLVYLVTAVVLFLTMICVGTTMMTVVMERRREIGLKKALGADNAAIIAEFLGEGAVLALAGGILGAFFGYFFAQAVSMSVFGRGVTLPLFLVLLTLGASLLVTILASLIPVRIAADVEPALVLRGE
jgi:putative ABC transport system permease protein